MPIDRFAERFDLVGPATSDGYYSIVGDGALLWCASGVAAAAFHDIRGRRRGRGKAAVAGHWRPCTAGPPLAPSGPMRWMWPVAAWVGFWFGGCATDSEACGRAPPLCSDQELIGECSDAVSEVDATCDGEAWVCDEGFHLAEEIQCTWPIGCEGAAPLCDNQPYGGQCLEDPDVVSAVCVGDLEWQCPEGYRFEGQTGCVPPLDCGDGPVPVCNDQVVVGECSDGVVEVPAECIVGEYACPDGYHFEDEVNCIPPADCEDPAPSCFAAGDCTGVVEPAFCGGSEWICPDGFDTECGYPCGEGQAAPDECWDQGPGKCSDTTQPASCVDAFWSCPAGWDFGGFGEDCRFPG